MCGAEVFEDRVCGGPYVLCLPLVELLEQQVTSQLHLHTTHTQTSNREKSQRAGHRGHRGVCVYPPTNLLVLSLDL